jgi:hypothetical protein
MARCGCGGNACSCKIIAGPGIQVQGNGTASDPFKVTALSSSIMGLLEVDSTSTVDLTLLGAGTPADPFVLKADVGMRIADLEDVANTAPTNGQVLAYNATTGLFQPITPAAGGTGGGGGAGTVTSVNGKSPDGLGGVTLTAADISALPSTYVPTWAALTGKPATFAPAAHTHTVANISDSTVVGRALLVAADAAAARSAIGAQTPWQFGVLPVAYYNGTQWPARSTVVPSGYTGRVVWDSAESASAPAPDGHIVGDRWFRASGVV